MGRKPTGLPLTFRPLRLDDEVWAAIQDLRDRHKTINAGFRSLFGLTDEISSGLNDLLALSKKKLNRLGIEVTEIDLSGPVKRRRGPLLKPKEKK